MSDEADIEFLDINRRDAHGDLANDVSDPVLPVEDQALMNPELIASELQRAIERTLVQLSERERRVLTLRFGLDRGAPRTLEQVGAELGVTRQRVQQIEAEAMKKIRRS